MHDVWKKSITIFFYMNFHLSTIEKQAIASTAMKHQLHHVSRLILGEGMFLRSLSIAASFGTSGTTINDNGFITRVSLSVRVSLFVQFSFFGSVLTMNWLLVCDYSNRVLEKFLEY